MTDKQIKLLFEALSTILKNQKYMDELGVDAFTNTDKMHRKCVKMVKKLKKEENNDSIDKH